MDRSEVEAMLVELESIKEESNLFNLSMEARLEEEDRRSIAIGQRSTTIEEKMNEITAKLEVNSLRINQTLARIDEFDTQYVATLDNIQIRLEQLQERLTDLDTELQANI